jgi:hypothetical protein
MAEVLNLSVPQAHMAQIVLFLRGTLQLEGRNKSRSTKRVPNIKIVNT